MRERETETERERDRDRKLLLERATMSKGEYLRTSCKKRTEK